MSLKEKLDRFRSDSPSRFTEEQRRIMRWFQDNVDAMMRRTPREGDCSLTIKSTPLNMLLSP